MIVLKRNKNAGERVSECGRVVVQMLREKEKRVFKWYFDFPPFMGTKFDFIAYNRPGPHSWYDKKSRTKSRVRARTLFDALDDGLGAEVGFMRKPRRNPTPKIRVNTPPKQGANRHSLRDALDNRARSVPGYGNAASCLAVLYPSVEIKRATADQLFDTLYALAWAQAWGRNLNDWRGMTTEEIAT